MTFEQIKELLNDGFTPEQITLLTTSAVSPTPAADPAPEPAPVIPLPEETTGANIEEKPAEPAQPEPEKEPAVPNKDIIDAIQDLKKTIQANNILTRSTETVNPDNELEKAMAEFIRPSFNKDE